MKITGISSWTSLRRLGPLGVGLVLVIAIAFIADLSRFQKPRSTAALRSVNEDVQQIIIGLAGKPYVDPTGLFSIIPPDGWEVHPRSEDVFYDVSFVNPGRASLNIMATSVPYDDLPSLYEAVRARERDFSIFSNYESERFQEVPSIKRTAKLPDKVLIAHDFVLHHVAYHILLELPSDFVPNYEFALGEILKTFKPLAPSPQPDTGVKD